MTYFGFLLRFLLIPIGGLVAIQLWRLQRSAATARRRIGALWASAAIQVALALLYTSPWDNYLVASGVWRYDPALVSGRVIGHVPLEEYTFFVLETLLVAQWWCLISNLIRPAAHRPSKQLRIISFAGVAAVWIISTAVLLGGWKPGTYLTFIVSWALPPMAIQLAFGADILWQHRKLLAAVILPLGTYLSIADAIAIAGAIWTISPAQSTRLLLGNLPVEEAAFFFATVFLLTFGMTLSLAPESPARLTFLVRKLQALSRSGDGQAGRARAAEQRGREIVDASH
jgi:lycopene cyclase domain-containing protein